jgi:general secretion pathway protein D
MTGNRTFLRTIQARLAHSLFGMLLVLFGLVAVADAAEKEKVALNFVNTDIDAVVKAVSIISGRNFVLDPRVKGTINVVSSSPIAPELAYPILISALRLQGYTVVDGNGTGVTKIIPESDAKTHAIPTTTRSGSHEYRIVTRVFPIRSESAAQLLPILRPLVTTNNSISVYPANNTLVITDYADNIKRLEKVIESIEASGSENPAVFRLKHIGASDIHGLLSKLFGEGSAASGADPSQRAAIVVDSRSNSIVVRTENAAVLGRIRTLLNELDQAPMASGNIHVVPLKNAEASKLAVTLRAILSGEASSSAIPPLGSPAGAAAATAANAAAQGEGLVKGSLIQADSTTNSLIIMAPDPVFNNLRRVIDALDRRRAQVYIEALIVEISADRATELGFQWQTFNGTGSSETKFFAGTNFGASTGNSITRAGRGGAGFSIGVIKGANLGVLARYLETNANANILSTPNVITLDNEEGKIVIGQNRPFVTGQYAQTGGATTPTPFQTIERRDVGLSLKVKPQISEGGTVRVQIAQEVSSINSENALGPVTNKRSIDSTVLVDDGGIIALGGLIEDNYASGEEKVPLLGDIPVVGNMFRYDTRKRTKTNLMVFLRPQVIRDESGYAKMAVQQYDRVQGEQGRVGTVGNLMPGEEPPPKLPGTAQDLLLKLEPKLQKGPASPQTPAQ